MLSPYVCQQFLFEGLTHANLTGVYTITERTFNDLPIYQHEDGFQLAKVKSQVSSGSESREMEMWGITGVDVSDTLCVTDMFNFAPDKVEHVAETGDYSWFCLSGPNFWVQETPELTCMDPDCPLYVTMTTYDLDLQDLNGYYAYSSVFEGAARYTKLDTEIEPMYDIVNINGEWTLRDLEKGIGLLEIEGIGAGGLCPPDDREWQRVNSYIDGAVNISMSLTNETRCPGGLGAECSKFIMLQNLDEYYDQYDYREYASLGGVYRYSETRWRNGFPMYVKSGGKEYAFFKEGLWHFFGNTSISNVRCMCDPGFVYMTNRVHPCFHWFFNAEWRFVSSNFASLQAFNSEESVRELCPQYILVVDLPQDLYMLFGLYQIYWNATMAYPKYVALYGESGTLRNTGSGWLFASDPAPEHCMPNECRASRPSTGFFCPTQEESIWTYFDTRKEKEVYHIITIDESYLAPSCHQFVQIYDIRFDADQEIVQEQNPPAFSSALGAYEHRQRAFNGAVQYRQLDQDNEMGMTLFRVGLNLFLGVLNKDFVARRLNSSEWCPSDETEGWEVRCSDTRDGGFCPGKVEMYGQKHPPLCKLYLLVSLPSDRNSPIVGVWEREYLRPSNATMAYSSIYKSGAPYYRKLRVEPSGLLEWDHADDPLKKHVAVSSYFYRSSRVESSSSSWIFQEDFGFHTMAYRDVMVDICPRNGTHSWTVEVTNDEGNLTAWIEEDVTFTFYTDLAINLCDSFKDEIMCNNNRHCAWSIHQLCQTCMIHQSVTPCQEAKCMWVGNTNYCLGGSELTHRNPTEVRENQVAMSLEFIFVCTLAILFSLISIFIAKKILTEHQEAQDEESQYRGATEKEIDKLELKSFEIILDETKKKKKELKKQQMQQKQEREREERKAQEVFEVSKRNSSGSYRQSRERISVHRKRESETRRLSSRSDERRIPRLSLQSIDSSDVSISEVSEMECAICMCPFEPSENLRLLPCGHFFHVECIKKWLVTRSTCPFCRKDITET